jgi:hypothetical protein
MNEAKRARVNAIPILRFFHILINLVQSNSPR